MIDKNNDKVIELKEIMDLTDEELGKVRRFMPMGYEEGEEEGPPEDGYEDEGPVEGDEQGAPPEGSDEEGATDDNTDSEGTEEGGEEDKAHTEL